MMASAFPANVGCTNRTELNLRQGGRFPIEILIKVETLRRMPVQLEFFGNSFADHADARTRIQDEFQMGLVSDAALDLDKVPGDKPEGQRAAGRIFR
jgi:hypothetical protein